MKVKEQIQMAWVNGIYVKQALESTILVAGLADKSTYKKMPDYPKEMPFVEKRELSIKEQRELAIAKMEKWFKINNKL